MGFELIKVQIIWRVFMLIWTGSQIFHQSKTFIAFTPVIANDLRFSGHCGRLAE